MAQPTTEELLARIETLEGRQRSRSRRRGAKTLFSVVALAALLAVPIGVFANHSFTDVPNSHTFHTVIGRVKGAGITAGCTATTYCPEANVSRGQMAAFLARTGGRISTAGMGQLSGIPVTADGATPTVLTTVTIKAGDVTGGYAVVQLTGSVTAYTTSATGLPSYTISYIREAGTVDALSSYGFTQVDELAGGFFGIATAGLVGSVTVPTGVTKTYEVVSYRVWGTGTFAAFATLSAVYVPFRGDGSNALPAAAPAPESERSPLLGP